jgi:ATP-dependent Clp protease ATP-binding subunit ClpC
LPEAKNAIVELSYHPCSLIIVGVGSNIDWGKFEQFLKAGGSIGFSEKAPDAEYDHMKNTIEESMKKMFNPEFLNRIDDYIVFRQLKKEHIFSIIDIQLSKLLTRMQAMNIEIHLTIEAKEFLVDKGYDEKYGARPLRRAIQKYLEDPMAEEIIKNNLSEGDEIDVDYNKEKDLIIVNTQKPKSKKNKKEDKT